MDLLSDLPRRKTVERRFAGLLPAELVFTREGHDGLALVLALFQIGIEYVVVLHCAFDAARHHHPTGLATDQALGQHLIVEVVDHDLGL